MKKKIIFASIIAVGLGVAAISVLAQGSFSVVVSKVGDGNVASDPAGIHCGSTCSASFSTSSTVSLSARPSGTSTFLYWEGGSCLPASSTTCTVEEGNATSVFVTAVFSG
jgi:hypothetical protein